MRLLKKVNLTFTLSSSTKFSYFREVMISHTNPKRVIPDDPKDLVKNNNISFWYINGLDRILFLFFSRNKSLSGTQKVPSEEININFREINSIGFCKSFFCICYLPSVQEQAIIWVDLSGNI